MYTRFMGGLAGSGSTPIINQSDLWANRANYQTNGNIVRFTDVDSGQLSSGGGSFWFYSTATSKWKPVNNEAMLDAVDTGNNNGGVAAQTQLNGNHNPIFPGVVQLYDRLDFEATFAKTGSTSSATLRLHLGTTGTIADQVIATMADLATTNQKAGYRMVFKRDSATTIQVEGSNSPTNPFAGATTGGQQASFTVGNFDTQTQYFSISVQLDTADTVTLVDYRLKLAATDS